MDSPISWAPDAIMAAAPDHLAVYRRGLCDVFALALHARTGWPLALVEGLWPLAEDEQWDDEAEAREAAHAVCLVPPLGVGPSDSRAVLVADVDGVQVAGAVMDACLFSGPVTRVVVRPVDAAEVATAFTTEPVDQDALARADAIVRAFADRWPLPAAEPPFAPHPGCGSPGRRFLAGST